MPRTYVNVMGIRGSDGQTKTDVFVILSGTGREAAGSGMVFTYIFFLSEDLKVTRKT